MAAKKTEGREEIISSLPFGMRQVENGFRVWHIELRCIWSGPTFGLPPSS
jgi:hypothetical protein